MEGKDEKAENTVAQAPEGTVDESAPGTTVESTEDKVATSMEEAPAPAAPELPDKSLPEEGAKVETTPPAAAPEATGHVVTVVGAPTAPAPEAAPAKATRSKKPRAPLSPLQLQQICLLALRGFTMLTALLAFSIGASVKGYYKKSLNFLIAATVIVFVENGAFLAILSLQLVGSALKGHLEKLIAGVAVLLDLLLLLLAFGSSTSFATRINLGCLPYDDHLCSSKAKAAVSMGFLASLSQLGTVVVGGYLFHLLYIAPAADAADDNAKSVDV